MQIEQYYKEFNKYFGSDDTRDQLKEACALLGQKKRLFFIGNGGSNAICSHMYEDYAKIGGFQTFTFSDPSMITCFANDYGYENAMKEWLRIYFQEGDVLIAISSSGKSKNILNAAAFAEERRGDIITLSGFEQENLLKVMGHINFHIPVSNYGIVECYHQVILHVILDSLETQ